MKKRMYLYLILIFLFIFIGCNEKIPQLNCPTNVRIEQNYVRWNIVEGATYYSVSINGNEYLCTENYLNLLDYKDVYLGQNCTISVKTCGDGVNFISSDYSETKNYIYENEGSNSNNPINNNIVKRRYVTNPLSNGAKLIDSYTDGRYNYFYFYLGYVENVPVSYEIAEEWNGISSVELSYNMSFVSETEISQTMSRCISQTVSEEHKESLNTNISFGAEVFSTNVNINAEKGIESINIMSTNQSTSTTMKTASKWIESHSRATKYSLSEEDKYGYYRYTLFATCDVYVIVIFDKETSKIAYEYLNCARESTYYYGIDYSEDGYFESDSNNKLYFNFSVLNSINLNAELKENSNFIQTLPKDKLIYENNEQYKVVSSGSWGHSFDETDWGLSHDGDKIDLSAYSKYLNDSYEIILDISIDIEEIDDGYQEIYLYDRFEKHGNVSSSDVYDRNKAENSGLVRYIQDINHGSSIEKFTRNITWELLGSECNENMYIRYGAHGEFSDDWLKKKIVVKITIIEK